MEPESGPAAGDRPPRDLGMWLAACAVGGIVLGAFGLAPWLTQRRHESRESRLLAILAHGAAGSEEDAAWALGLLADPGDLPVSLRALAAAAVAKADPRGRRSLDRLLELLRDPRTPVRQTAAAALGQMGSAGLDSEPAREALRAALADPEPIVRAGAATALGMSAPAREPTVEALLRRTGDPDLDVRQSVLWALANAAKDDVRLPAALTAGLEDAAPKVRHRAAQLLGELGPRAMPALPALERLRDDPDPHVKKAAEAAATRIRGAPQGR